MIQLTDKRILITGASSGIGKQLALELARYNTRLILVSRNLQKLKNVAEEIESLYPLNVKPIIFSCDVTIPDEVRKIVNKAQFVWGGIDILINNAGIGVYGPIHKTTIEDFKNVLNVNFFGAVHFTLETLPGMLRSESGCIVFISSVASSYGIPCYSAYSASKSALRSFNQTLNVEYGSQGICSLHISPDYTKTDFFENEKITGGALYHTENYRSLEKTVKEIVRKIKFARTESELSFRGKMLRIATILFPRFVHFYFSKCASKLILRNCKDEKEIINHRSLSESGR